MQPAMYPENGQHHYQKIPFQKRMENDCRNNYKLEGIN